MNIKANSLEVAGSQIEAKFGKNSMVLWGGVALLIVLSAIVYVLSTQNQKVDQKAKEALFRVQQMYAEELKPLLPVEEKTPAIEKDTKKSEPKKPEAKKPDPEFKLMDVDATFPKTVKGYQEFIEQHKDKSEGFDAQLMLGGLYLNHGQNEKALELFEKAQPRAKSLDERFEVGQAKAVALENLSKYQPAIQIYETLSKELIANEAQSQMAKLAAARLWLKVDPAKGKTLLSEIEKKDPNSELAKQARTFRLLAQ